MIIPVDLERDFYNVFIDHNESLTEKLVEKYPENNFVLITNRTIEKLKEEAIRELEKNLSIYRYVIEDGEEYKNLDTIASILDYLLSLRLDRNTVVLAFGGGVVGDIAGFAASLYLRGVRYVQIPTTLLAMVDSSVGGKTGVNHKMGKNLIGTFHQPEMVWICTEFLDSLPEREFYSGYAEVYKYGFIGGKEMFDFIVQNHEDIIKRKKETIRNAIRKSVEIKAEIVKNDEYESGVRALLNLGHTFGHALERSFGYRGIFHGEGVFWGIKCAVDLGKRTGMIKPEYHCLFDNIVESHTLPGLVSAPDIGDMYKAMFSDKKVRNGKLHFVLPVKPGKAKIVSGIKKEDIMTTLNDIFLKR